MCNVNEKTLFSINIDYKAKSLKDYVRLGREKKSCQYLGVILTIIKCQKMMARFREDGQISNPIVYFSSRNQTGVAATNQNRKTREFSF